MENEHCSSAPNSSFFSNQQPTLKKSEHFNPNFDDWIPERDNGLSGYVVQNGANASNEGETETTTVHRTKDLDCQICHEESLKPENASAKENKTGQDVQRGQDLLSTLKKSEHFNPNFDKGILERDDSLSVCAVENGENSSNEGETETRNVYKTKDLDCQICHEESLKSENASAKENKTGQDVQRGQDLLLTFKKSKDFNPNLDKGILERDDSLSVCAVENGENSSNEGETETRNVYKTKDLDCQICHEESLKSENASAKENKTGQDVQRGQDLLLTFKKSKDFNPNLDKGIMERDDCLSVCAVENGENSSNEGETETTNVYKTEDLDCQICHEESLKSENASAKENETGQDVQCGQDLLSTFKKSEHFNPNFDEGIMDRDDGLSICAVENDEKASTKGEAETTNVYNTEDLDCQICHEKPLKSENASAKENNTGHDVQRGQDLPLTADAALNNTLNMSDANFSISGPNFFKIPIEGIDEDVLYKEVNGKTQVCVY